MTRTGFLNKYHVDKQSDFTSDPDACMFGNAPYLSQVNAAFRGLTAQEWLTYQLGNLSEFCGVKNKITPYQTEELANLIVQDFYYLKVTELMLFFRYFKSGRYGHFFGSVDPQVIMSWLRDFCAECGRLHLQHDRELADIKEQQERRNAISYEEYLRRKKVRENN